MKRNKIILLFWAILLLSCDSSKVYHNYVDFEYGFWHSDSIQRFPFTITSTDEKYNLLVTFRNSVSYPYYNLYFQYVLLDSSGTEIIKELQDINLFDPKTGKPMGSGVGDLFDHEIPLQKNYSFDYSGEYQIELQQYMRMDTLPLLLSVGVMVELATP